MDPKKRVLQSINHPALHLCVDLFENPDGTFGFEIYRRDPEENHGWYPVGHFGHLKFKVKDEAKTAAVRENEWLADFANW